MQVNQALYDQIVAHARAEAPNESCGLLIDGKYFACPNLAAEPKTEFEIHPETIAEAYATGKFQAVIHSHPDGMDYPSKTDLEQQAVGDVPWGIICLNDAKGHKPDLFFWGDQLPIEPYEGRRFRSGVADCFALVRDWYRQEHGIILQLTPRDNEWWNAGQNVIEDNIAAGAFPGFHEVSDAPRHGDVLLARIGSKCINHTGIYIDHGKVLHHLSNRPSRIDVLGPWMRFVVKRMRHVQSNAAT
jgi:proteasome lid subunit RPN8/RPN11